MTWKNLDQRNLNGKRVLTRVDINVPMNGNDVGDATRIERIVPTIQKIIAANGIPIMISHFGRPGAVKDDKYSLKHLIPCLTEHLGQNIVFTDVDEIETIIKQSKSLKIGQIMLLENIRFRTGETNNDPVLAKKLAEIGDVYCNDAFSTAHRAHASTVGIANLLPNCVGCLMEAELLNLEEILSKPKGPVIAIVGGSKVSTKIDLLMNLIKKVDTLVITGGMANTFLRAQGHNIGKSIFEQNLLETADKIRKLAQKESCQLILPSDVIVAGSLKRDVPWELFEATKCPENQMILDIGPKTVNNIKQAINRSQTLIWNGPMGAFEVYPFNKATDDVATFVSQLTQKGKLISVAGGGDTISALKSTRSESKFSYISTAGGAFLEWIEGKKLPAIEALIN
ncbi:MAG: phosphoglycerate kinase [Paracoccaceae bacterium]|jgi:phosphoglycerate kinase|nr:phosphoglycerate kinase [Paracoccaceae bacterium]MDG1880431.1 phosphoglycerate kinase [Paracoccaceae bacterium]MDG1939512.1 phosphoglycerate kinase [Paracoccaceae bacterium]|tara:strand:- start:2844 stop:4034 length:1191 start_codon:yes stop_codon:yes gene_type:complete